MGDRRAVTHRSTIVVALCLAFLVGELGASTQPKWPLLTEARDRLGDKSTNGVVPSDRIPGVVEFMNRHRKSVGQNIDAAWAVYLCAFRLARTRRREPPSPELRDLLDLAVEAATRTKNVVATTKAYHLRANLLDSWSRHHAARADYESAFRRAKGSKKALSLRIECGLRLAELSILGSQWERTREILDEIEVELGDRQTSDRALLWSLRGERASALGLIDQAVRYSDSATELARTLGLDGPTDASKKESSDAQWARENLRLKLLLHRSSVLLARERFDRLIRELTTARESFERLASAKSALDLRIALAMENRERLQKWLGDGSSHAAESTSMKVFARVLEDPHAGVVDRASATAHLAHAHLRRRNFDAAAPLLDQLEAQSAPTTDNAAYWAALRVRWARISDRPRRERSDHLATLLERHRAVLADWDQLSIRRGGIGLLQFKDSRFVLAEIIAETAALNGDERGAREGLAHLRETQRRAALSRTLTADRVPPTIGPGPQELLLAVIPAADFSLVLASTATGDDLWTIADRDTLDQLRRAWVESIRVPPPPSGSAHRDARTERRAEQERLGTRLARELIPDALIKRLHWHSRVTLIAPDLLGALPFEALPVIDAVPFGVTHEICAVPSLTVRDALFDRSDARVGGRDLAGSESEDSGPGRLLLVMGPTHGTEAQERWPSLEPLPIDEGRARLIAASYESADVDVLTGDDARADAVQTLAANATILQYIGHGVQRADEERTAGLIFAPEVPPTPEGPDRAKSIEDPGNGLVFAEDLESWRVGPVVLVTACSAGGGPRRAGDSGGADLTGAFLLAGADCVVAPDTAIYLEPVEIFSREFHVALASGTTIAGAVRAGRRALHADERWRDPFYHAAIRAWGLGHAPCVAPRPRSVGYDAIGLTVTVIILLTACGSLLFRRAVRPRGTS